MQIDEAFAEATVVVSGDDALGDGDGGLGGGGKGFDVGAVEDDFGRGLKLSSKDLLPKIENLVK